MSIERALMGGNAAFNSRATQPYRFSSPKVAGRIVRQPHAFPVQNSERAFFFVKKRNRATLLFGGNDYGGGARIDQGRRKKAWNRKKSLFLPVTH